MHERVKCQPHLCCWQIFRVCLTILWRWRLKIQAAIQQQKMWLNFMRVLFVFLENTQRSMKKPVKHLRWSVLQKWLTARSCLIEFWIHLWCITALSRKFYRWKNDAKFLHFSKLKKWCEIFEFHMWQNRINS